MSLKSEQLQRAFSASEKFHLLGSQRGSTAATLRSASHCAPLAHPLIGLRLDWRMGRPRRKRREVSSSWVVPQSYTWVYEWRLEKLSLQGTVRWFNEIRQIRSREASQLELRCFQYKTRTWSQGLPKRDHHFWHMLWTRPILFLMKRQRNSNANGTGSHQAESRIWICPSHRCVAQRLTMRQTWSLFLIILCSTTPCLCAHSHLALNYFDGILLFFNKKSV